MRGFLAPAFAAALLLVGCLGSQGTDLSKAPKTLTVSSAFSDGQAVPREFTCQGSDASPPLAFAGVPGSAKVLAFILDDPDAPKGTFTHWTFWNLPASTASLPQGAQLEAQGARVGLNDAGAVGYTGPCPPSGTHHYRFQLYALDGALDVPQGAPRSQLEAAIAPHELAWGLLTGTYAKS